MADLPRTPSDVGQIVSLTGNYSPLGSENKKSVELAVEQINSDGGVLGRQDRAHRQGRQEPARPVRAGVQRPARRRRRARSSGRRSPTPRSPRSRSVDRAEIPYLSLTPADEQVNPLHPYVFVVPATSSHLRGADPAVLPGHRSVHCRRRARHAAARTRSPATRACRTRPTSTASRWSVSEEFQTDATEFGAVFGHVRSSDAQALMVWATGAPAVALTKQYATAGLDHPAGADRRAGQQAVPRPGRRGGRGRHGGQLDRRGRLAPARPASRRRRSTSSPRRSREKYGYPPPQFAQDGYSAVKLLVGGDREGGRHRAGEDPGRAGEPEPGHAERRPTTTARPTTAGCGTEFISVNTVTRARSCRPSGPASSWPGWAHDRCCRWTGSVARSAGCSPCAMSTLTSRTASCGPSSGRTAPASPRCSA